MKSEIEIKKQLLDYLFTLMTQNRRDKFEEIIQSRTRHITVVLEDIFQPHNASAVLRSCDCFGIQDVHIIENRNTYELKPNVALGSSKWVNMNMYNEFEDNTIEAYNSLRKQGYKIVATTPHTNDMQIEDLALDQKVALVFGTELEGLSQIAIDNADSHVKIPMYGFTESFNISVSAAISLFYLTEKLRKSEIDWQLTEEESLDTKLNWARASINKAELIEREFYNKRKD